MFPHSTFSRKLDAAIRSIQSTAASGLAPLPSPPSSIAHLDAIKKKRLRAVLRNLIAVHFDWFALGVPFLIIAVGTVGRFDMSAVVTGAALAVAVLIAVKLSADSSRERTEGRYFDLIRAHLDLLRTLAYAPPRPTGLEAAEEAIPRPCAGPASFLAAWTTLQEAVAQGLKRPRKIYREGYDETCWESWSQLDRSGLVQPYVRSLDLLMRYLAENYYGEAEEARFSEHLRAHTTVHERRFIWLEARLREMHPKDRLFSILADRYFFGGLPFVGSELDALRAIPLNEHDWNEKFERRREREYVYSPTGIPPFVPVEAL
jgi:hypothetical protein